MFPITQKTIHSANASYWWNMEMWKNYLRECQQKHMKIKKTYNLFTYRDSNDAEERLINKYFPISNWSLQFKKQTKKHKI